MYGARDPDCLPGASKEAHRKSNSLRKKLHDARVARKNTPPKATAEVEPGSQLYRISRIIRWWVKNRANHLRGCGGRKRLTKAITQFAEETGLPRHEIEAIIGKGRPPTPHQLQQITSRLNWSIGFMFGINEDIYRQTESQFFFMAGLTNPTLKDKMAFRELYDKALLLGCLQRGDSAASKKEV